MHTFGTYLPGTDAGKTGASVLNGKISALSAYHVKTKGISRYTPDEAV